jgi:FKBP-type peptidyl-prolyl cis-trans isomerase FkpA
MRSIIYNIIFWLFLICIISCKYAGYTETVSGLRYKIVRNSKGTHLRKGDYVVLNMEYFDDNDSLLYSSIGRRMPVTILYNDSIWQNSGQAYEGFSKLKVGDSAILKVKCHDLYLRSFRMPIPKGLKSNEIITFHVAVVNTMNEDEFNDYQKNLIAKRQAAKIAREEKQLIEDTGIIDSYLDDKKIIPMESESGLRYVIQREGTGRNPNPGDSVFVDYTGMLLDGTVFESSRQPGKPFGFPVGEGMVIKGWDEGISLMKKGGKYTFYIPSPLAYGDRGMSVFIRPNSILVFEIELLNIKINKSHD